MSETLEAYASHLNASGEVIQWLKTTGAKALKAQKISESAMEHILDFLVSPSAPPRLQKMSIIDAKRKTDEWSKANQKKGRNLKDSDEDIELIHDFFDGTTIVRLKTKPAFQREGFLMGHCVGSYSADDVNRLIYSYRDKNNNPHATFEVNKSGGEIVQIKGKGNGAIHPKYIHPILAFLKTIGFEIRPNDMQNLGYWHIHEAHVDFLKKYPTASPQIVMINGQAYVGSK